MINEKDNYLAWVQLIDELDEAKEHLEEMTKKMNESSDYDEAYFSVDLGHVYAHLNRAWNGRFSEKGLVYEDWDEINKFPTDIEPVG